MTSSESLRLVGLSLRYSSWTIRPWLALTHAGINFETVSEDLHDIKRQEESAGGAAGVIDARAQAGRRALGSVTGLFPVLWVGDTPIHESLAICEWAAETSPESKLWPEDRLERAQARAISAEMASGFGKIRTFMSCHVNARVPGFKPNAATQTEVNRVLDMWESCLERSGGPFLFGDFGIADCMYFPVVTRFATYDVELSAALKGYVARLAEVPAVQKWAKLAEVAAPMPAYDDMIRELGGDPAAAKPLDCLAR